MYGQCSGKTPFHPVARKKMTLKFAFCTAEPYHIKKKVVQTKNFALCLEFSVDADKEQLYENRQ
jgi:hypothetical protein